METISQWLLTFLSNALWQALVIVAAALCCDRLIAHSHLGSDLREKCLHLQGFADFGDGGGLGNVLHVNLIWHGNGHRAVCALNGVCRESSAIAIVEGKDATGVTLMHCVPSAEGILLANSREGRMGVGNVRQTSALIRR